MSWVQTDSYTSMITEQNGDGETKTESSYKPQKCQLSGIVSRNLYPEYMKTYNTKTQYKNGKRIWIRFSED